MLTCPFSTSPTTSAKASASSSSSPKTRSSCPAPTTSRRAPTGTSTGPRASTPRPTRDCKCPFPSPWKCLDRLCKFFQNCTRPFVLAVFFPLASWNTPIARHGLAQQESRLASVFCIYTYMYRFLHTTYSIWRKSERGREGRRGQALTISTTRFHFLLVNLQIGGGYFVGGAKTGEDLERRIRAWLFSFSVLAFPLLSAAKSMVYDRWNCNCNAHSKAGVVVGSIRVQNFSNSPCNLSFAQSSCFTLPFGTSTCPLK